MRNAAEHELTRARLRTARWERLSQGLYALRTTDRPLIDRAGAFAHVLPRDSGFGHLSAAQLRGWWLPHLTASPVLFASTSSDVHVQRPGLYVRRSRLTELERLGDLPLTTPAQTLVELARDLTLVDLVPMVDCAVAAGTAAEAILAAAQPGCRGRRVLQRAVALADPRSESWWESVLRLVHVVAGLGPVDCQVDVTGDHGSIARADLHLVGTNRYPECDGGEHRTPDRHERDLRRDKAMLRAGAERYGYTAGEIARQPQVIIRDAEDARGLAHDERRVNRWWAVARASSLTPYGRTRLAGRLRRYQLAANR